MPGLWGHAAALKGRNDKYLGNLFYDLAKATVKRMAFRIARELEPNQVAVSALAPGFVGTERMLAAFAAEPRIAGVHRRPWRGCSSVA